MAALPWVVLIVGLGLRRSERSLEEAALLDASPRTVFFRVTLKNALPAIGAAILWTAVVTAGEMTVTDFYVIRTYAEELYTQTAIGQEPGLPPPSVLLGVAISVMLILAGVKFLNLFIPRERSLDVSPGLTFSLGRWRWPVVIITTCFLLVMLGIPLGNLIFKTGVVVTQTETGFARSFSIGKSLSMIVNAPIAFSREFGWSLSIGSVSATLAVLLGTILAWHGRNAQPRPRRSSFDLPFVFCNRRYAIFLFIAILISLPGPVLGLGVIQLLNRPEIPPLYWLYDHSILAPVMVLTLKSLPAATIFMAYALQSIPREVLESASVDGAGSWTQLWHIVLPMRWTAASAAWLIALAISLGDLAASILVVPPRVKMLSVSIFGLLHYGVEDRVAGICLALILLFALLAAVVLGIARRTSKSRQDS
jgi:iron(III) transport system permease protein